MRTVADILGSPTLALAKLAPAVSASTKLRIARWEGCDGM